MTAVHAHPEPHRTGSGSGSGSHAWVRWRPGVIASSDDTLRLPAWYGRLRVPVRHDTPGAGDIDLAVLRVPGTAARSGPPIVLLAGGPGTSGIERLRLLLPHLQPLLAVADVVTFDQRGTGASQPCLDSPYRLDLPLSVPGDRDAFLHHYRARSRQCAEYWTQRGVDLSAYTTPQNAADVDALREALGVEQISLFGASYGSHLALAVLRHYGTGVRHAVLALVEGPDHTIKLPQQIQAHLRDLDHRLRAAPTWRDRIPSLTGALADTLSTLDRKPAVGEIHTGTGGPVRVVADGFDTRFAIAKALGNADHTRGLPARIHALRTGSPRWLLQHTARYRRSWLPSAMTHVMDAASGASPQRLARVRAQAPHTLLGDLADFPLADVADAWEAPDLGPAYRTPVHSDVPVLLVSGTLDPRTPPGNATEVAAGLTRHQHLIVDGMTHENPLTVPAVAAAIADFYHSGQTHLCAASVEFRFEEEP